MPTIVSIQQGGTGANNATDALAALGVIGNTGGEFTGEVQFTGPNNSINVANNALISGQLVVDERGLFGNGIVDYLSSQNIDSTSISVGGLIDNNGAGEVMAINKSNGALAYAEFIAINNQGDQDQGWVSVGVNSSEYNDPSYTLTGPDDGYLLYEAPVGSNGRGDLIIGTGSNGQNNHIVLAAGGFAPTDAQMIISPADVKEAEIVNSELISNVAILTTSTTHTFLANDQVEIASVGAPYDGVFTITAVTSNTFNVAIANTNTSSAAANGTATQILPFNKGTVQLTAQLFVGENSKSTIETADITLIQGHAIPLGIVVDNDGPGQTVMFNKSNGTLAYSEYIAHNDAGNVEMGWISMGINSSGYDDPEYPITKADDGYLLYEPPAGTTGDGDLIIGTGTNGTKNRLIFAAEGFDEANAQLIITPNESVRIAINTDSSSANTGALQVAGGIGVSGSVFVQGNQTIQGDLIVNGTQTIQSIDSVAASGPISLVGDGNQANTWDFGIVGTYAKSKTTSIHAITNKSLANNTATLTTANNHGFIIEDYADVSGVDSTFNGIHRITSVTANTFSYYKLANNISSTAATGNVIVSSSARYTGLVKETANAIWKLVSNIETRPAFIVDYANTALDSLRVATINADSFVTAAGVNIGSQANSAYAAANNAVLKAGDTMTGTLNISNSTAFITTGNVGIGTTNPGAKVQIDGNSDTSDEDCMLRIVDRDTTSGSQIPTIQFLGGSSANLIGAFRVNDQLGFQFRNNTNSTVVTFNQNGNVGIATTNPGYKLDVDGNARFRAGSLFLGLADTASAHINAYELMTFNIDSDNDDSDTRYFAWYKNGEDGSGTELMRLTEAGNVGIGFTTPQTKTHISLGGVNGLIVDSVYAGGGGSGEIYGDSANTVYNLMLRSSYSSNPESGGNAGHKWGILFTGYNGSSIGASQLGKGAGVFAVSEDTGAGYNRQVGLSFWTCSFDANIAERVRINSSGYVGIGTTNPGVELDIKRIANPYPLRIGSEGGQGRVIVYADVAASPSKYNWIAGSQYNVDNAYEITPSTVVGGYTFSTPALVINYLSNVGIGVTNPAVKLQVAGASIISNNTSIDPDSYANQTVAGAIADGSGWGVTSAIGGNAGTGDSWAIGHNGSGLFMGMQNGSAADTMQTYVQFETNRNLLLVPTSGNVGVGTGVPGFKLHVVGKIYSSTEVQGGSAILGDISYLGTAYAGFGSNSTAKGMWFARDFVNNYPDIVVASTGDVGIGTVPARKLHISGGSSNVQCRLDVTGADPAYTLTTLTQQDWSMGIDFSDSGKLKFGNSVNVGTNVRLTLDASGNVGIATQSPSYHLQVGTDAGGDTTDYGILVLRHGNGGSPGSWSTAKAAINISDTANAGPSAVDTTGVFSLNFGKMAISSTNAKNASLTHIGYDSGAESPWRIDGKANHWVGWNRSIGQTNDGSFCLLVRKGISVGSDYQTITPPDNGAIIQGNVGIGTTNPQARLHLDNGTSNALYIDTTVADSTTRDAIYLYENDGQASGRQAISWYNGNSSYYKARIWAQVGSNYDATRFSIEVANNARTVAERFWILDGNSFTSGSLTQNASDRRLKNNIQNIPNALEKLSKINGVNFNWAPWTRDMGFDSHDRLEVGVLAQEVQEVLPEAVKPAPFDSADGYSKSGENYLTVQMEKIVPLLIEAVKELESKLNAANEKIAELNSRLNQ